MDLEAPSVTLTYKGFFQLDILYALLAEELATRGWKPEDADQREYMERYYYHLAKPTGSYDWYAQWNVKRDWDMKHFTLFMSLSMRLITGKEEERVINGKPARGVNGEFTITIACKAVFDDTIFDKHWLTRMYKTLILNRYIGKYLGMAKDDAWDEAKSIRDMLAAHLNALGRTERTFHMPGETPFGA